MKAALPCAHIDGLMRRVFAEPLQALPLQLRLDRALARTLGQPSAAIAATQLTAKLVGLLVDRKESGEPGGFAGLQSEAEVLAMVEAELGAKSALVLAAELAKLDRDADRSAVEVNHDPAHEAGDTVSAVRTSGGRGAHHH
jgi:hypothetical protein